MNVTMKNLALRSALTNLLVPQDGNLNTTDFVFLLQYPGDSCIILHMLVWLSLNCVFF